MNAAAGMQVFPVIYGICLDAEAIWVGKAHENAKRPVLLSHGACQWPRARFMTCGEVAATVA